MSARGTASLLTRATGILAACFFVTSLTLSILASQHRGASPTILASSGGEGGLVPLQIPGQSAPAAPEAPAGPQAPQSE